MEKSGEAISKAAEAAIRQASGDWSLARRNLQEQVRQNDALREALVEAGLRRELHAAAARLGAATAPCLACGEEITIDSERCRFCGATVGSEVSSAVPQAPAKVNSGAPIIRHFTLLTGWILIVLIVILIISLAT